MASCRSSLICANYPLRRKFPAFRLEELIISNHYKEREKLERVVDVLRRAGLSNKFHDDRDEGSMFRQTTKYLLVAVLAGSAALNPATAQTNSGDPVWSSKPTRVDKTHQSLERLPPKLAEPTADKYPLKLKRALPFRVIDSVSFVHGGKKYRLIDLDAVPAAKICAKEDGQRRWACGLKSRVALAGLLRGKPDSLRTVEREGRFCSGGVCPRQQGYWRIARDNRVCADPHRKEPVHRCRSSRQARARGYLVRMRLRAPL